MWIAGRKHACTDLLCLQWPCLCLLCKCLQVGSQHTLNISLYIVVRTKRTTTDSSQICIITIWTVYQHIMQLYNNLVVLFLSVLFILSFSLWIHNIFLLLTFPPCCIFFLKDPCIQGIGCTITHTHARTHADKHAYTHAHTQLWQILLNICYDWADWAISYRRQCWERGGIQTCNNASTIEFQSATMVCVCVCLPLWSHK